MSLVAEMMKSSTMEVAQKRTVQRVVAGGRFCAVMLDDGGVGVANICPDVCGEPSPQVVGSLPQPGTSAADLLRTLGSSTHSAVGLATANALANRSCCWEERSTRGDLLDVLELRPDDQVGMVGCFAPLLEPVRRQVQQLSVFERGPRLTPELLPEKQALEMLPRCSVALITSTTIVNGTIDNLLQAATGCREVALLGPSTPFVPEIFTEDCCVTLMAGVVVLDTKRLLQIVEEGGGTRDFGASVAKVSVRVPLAS